MKEGETTEEGKVHFIVASIDGMAALLL